MTILNKLSACLVALFIISFMFLTITQDVYAGGNGPLLGCCQFDGRVVPSEIDLNSEEFSCVGEADSEVCSKEGGEFFPNSFCNRQTGMCSGAVSDVPTMSEWGLIATAVVLGFIGFFVIRRRKAAA